MTTSAERDAAEVCASRSYRALLGAAEQALRPEQDDGDQEASAARAARYCVET